MSLASAFNSTKSSTHNKQSSKYNQKHQHYISAGRYVSPSPGVPHIVSREQTQTQTQTQTQEQAQTQSNSINQNIQHAQIRS